MEKTVRTMMDLIAGEVCGKGEGTAPCALTEEAAARLYRLSASHDLAHLVGNALLAGNCLPAGEIRAKFEKQVMLAVYRYEQIDHELTRLHETLSAAGIPFTPLKGAVLRQYYPEPWMRTSCDIDILIRESDLDAAAQLLTDRLSYRKGEKGSHDVALYSDSGVHLELHYHLIEKNCVGTADTVLRSVWESAAPLPGTTEYVWSDEMFYYYHVAHMAKHFVIGGCGVRPFLDIWVLNHRLPENREKRNALLQKGGLLTFAERAEELAEVWFGDGEETEITRQMGNYLLTGGVYGTTGNRVAVQQVKKGGKARYALSRIWLPYDTLRFYYPSLEGKRLLLPLYEFRRWGKLIFCGGARRSAKELRLNSATTEKEQAQTAQMLRRLGLDR